jgi:acyl carrier protein
MSNTTKLHESFATALNIPIEQVTEELVYQGIPEWDSISHLMLVAELEERFGIGISTEDIPELNSLQAARTILGKYNISFSN